MSAVPGRPKPDRRPRGAPSTSAALRIGWGAALAAGLAAPWLLSAYWLGMLSHLAILGIASMGLMALTGFTGQVSLGHSAFVAVGAYAQALLLAQGWPFPLAMAGAVATGAGVGAVVGLSAVRLSGLHLAMATMAFAVVVEHVLVRWTGLTGGHTGMAVPTPLWLGIDLSATSAFYGLCLLVLLATLWGLGNLRRGAIGIAWIAVRDAELAAQSLGVRVAASKLLAFAVSAGVCALAGALMAHQLQYLTPEAFNLQLSLQLLLMVFVGGLGSLPGALAGAVVVGLLPVLIAELRALLPASIARRSGFELFFQGAMLAACVLWAPRGLAGWRWPAGAAKGGLP